MHVDLNDLSKKERIVTYVNFKLNIRYVSKKNH